MQRGGIRSEERVEVIQDFRCCLTFELVSVQTHS